MLVFKFLYPSGEMVYHLVGSCDSLFIPLPNKVNREVSRIAFPGLQPCAVYLRVFFKDSAYVEPEPDVPVSHPCDGRSGQSDFLSELRCAAELKMPDYEIYSFCFGHGIILAIFACKL